MLLQVVLCLVVSRCGVVITVYDEKHFPLMAVW